MIKLIKPSNIFIKLIKNKVGIFINIYSEHISIIIPNSSPIRIKKDEVLTSQSNIKFILLWLIKNNIIINKISFYGRGYKIITKKKKNLLVFNKSHIVLLYTNDIVLKFDKKNIIIINSNQEYNNYINFIYNIKSNNIYKKLGIRRNKKIIIKKKGKNITN